MSQALLALLLTLLSPGGYRLDRDIPYGEGSRRTLDVYRPQKAAPDAPLVVFIYGGGWDSGSKGLYRFVGAVLASQGVVTVIPDYRVYPEVRYPQFVEDAAEAVAWSHEHAQAFGADPDRMVLMGHSAGAHIAAMLTLDRRWLNRVGLDPANDIRGFVGLSGPYDFLPLHSDELKIIFGSEETRLDSQPINHVDGTAPPVLLITGDADTVVDPHNSDRLAARILAAGGKAETRHFARLNHADTIAAFLPVFRRKAPVLADAMAFIAAKAGPRPERRRAA